MVVPVAARSRDRRTEVIGLPLRARRAEKLARPTNLLLQYARSKPNEEGRTYATCRQVLGVTADRIAEITSQVEESEGSPPGVDSTGFELFFDEAQETAVFVAYFKTEQKLRDASKVFEDMEPSETPGTRASVDLCEVKLQRPFP